MNFSYRLRKSSKVRLNRAQASELVIILRSSLFLQRKQTGSLSTGQIIKVSAFKYKSKKYS